MRPTWASGSRSAPAFSASSRHVSSRSSQATSPSLPGSASKTSSAGARRRRSFTRRSSYSDLRRFSRARRDSDDARPDDACLARLDKPDRGVLIILFGLYMLGVFRMAFLGRERRVYLATKPAGYAGTVLVGVAFGAGWTPCIGPILGAVLIYTSSSADLNRGLALLLFYSIGLALPFSRRGGGQPLHLSLYVVPQAYGVDHE